MVGLKFPCVSADIVTISHGHKDHNRADLVKDVKKVVNGPGEYEITGISIIGIGSYHDEKKGELRGKNTIYVLEVDGFRLAHLGDLGHKLTTKMLEEIGDIDILFIPVGGVYTMEPAVAAEVAREIEPNIVVPMHYKVSGLDEKTFGKLSTVEPFLSDLGLSVERMQKLSIKKSDLDEEQKIVILETRK
jgi:L-ascorbate metabolism protein UlaG (beta-lactamase superfamily)